MNSKIRAKRLLTKVVDFLNEDSLDGCLDRLMFWHILTALRGPDNDDGELKLAVTAPLRGKIGLHGNQGQFCGTTRA